MMVMRLGMMMMMMNAEDGCDDHAQQSNLGTDNRKQRD